MLRPIALVGSARREGPQATRRGRYPEGRAKQARTARNRICLGRQTYHGFQSRRIRATPSRGLDEGDDLLRHPLPRSPSEGGAEGGDPSFPLLAARPPAEQPRREVVRI